MEQCMVDQSNPAGTDTPNGGGFECRHIGPDAREIKTMLDQVGCASLAEVMERAMPDEIRQPQKHGAPALSESDALAALWTIAERNVVVRSCIGMGYHDVILPPVILRSILENPCWYTQYTPYQSEISQGRLEALLNFQTMVTDLTGLPVANASLLDEGTAAAEAMLMCRQIARGDRSRFIVSDQCHPQTIAVLAGRAEPLGIVLDVCDETELENFDGAFGLLVQQPDTRGRLQDWSRLTAAAADAGLVCVAAADPLSLAVSTPPGEMGFDIAVGSTQRFGVPMGFGGPHAAYMATRAEHVRKMPGRIIGVSRDATGAPALRMAIQTREQHIKRDRATSNICTAQVLLAIMASMYAVWHGPSGLRRIAERVRRHAERLAAAIEAAGGDVLDCARFDSVTISAATPEDADAMVSRALESGYNLRRFPNTCEVGVSLDETTTDADVEALARAVAGTGAATDTDTPALPQALERQSGYLLDDVFNSHQSETKMLRYITQLQSRDLSLAHSMIPLGSCTMKLNATSEMLPVSWRTFGGLHPFAPRSQWAGYAELFEQLQGRLAELTGFDAVSLQPNAGSQGEYAGLLTIRAWHRSRGDLDRDICLIPMSAHGTNPASAVVAGFKVVPVACDSGDISLEDLEAKIEAHQGRIGAIMITYPSTHGVFEKTIGRICELVHDAGGQVYLDGANLNAMLGYARPGDIGADVCHLNLHKTFCIPHGGGGPGMGPIATASHLTPFLPGHPVSDGDREQAIAPVSAAAWGSASILPISWMYIMMMGDAGLARASAVSVLSANYMASRLSEHYPVLFLNPVGFCAHEFIIDLRSFDKSAGIKPDDVAKRLMDYGFHAPTMSWPVPGTLMIEPTESESLAELDRYCEALISIRAEIAAIECGQADREDNVLRNAPHPLAVMTSDTWPHSYARSEAAWPLPWLRTRKFWPPVARVDNPWGDRNLACTCDGMGAFSDG
jgi:glycine dehydrogenase